MTIQHRLPNPVNPLWVGLSVVAVGGMMWAYFDAKRREDEESTGPVDVEVIPPSAWNPSVEEPGMVQTVTEGQLYTAVFTGPLISQGEFGPGDVPAYVIDYLPPDAFTIHDVDYSVGISDGEPTHSEVKIFFTPHRVGDGAALIRATAPVPAGTFRQLHLEIE